MWLCIANLCLRPGAFLKLARCIRVRCSQQQTVRRCGQDTGHMLDNAAAHTFSDSDEEDGIYNEYM